MANKVFETSNTDFASFLILNKIQFLGLRLQDVNNPVVLLQFEDAKQNCSDLEHVFLSSEFKQFRDINKSLLKAIHKFKSN